MGIEGRLTSSKESPPVINYCVASRGYFPALGIPLLKGQFFPEEKRNPDVIMISDRLARRFWPNEDPVGKRITFNDPQEGPWMTIAGVVGDVRHEDFLAEPSGMIFEPYYQSPPLQPTYVIRTQIDCRQLVPTAKRAIWDVDRNLPLYQVMTMEEVLSNSIAEPRHYMGFLTCFGMLAIFLAETGTYASWRNTLGNGPEKMPFVLP